MNELKYELSDLEADAVIALLTKNIYLGKINCKFSIEKVYENNQFKIQIIVTTKSLEEKQYVEKGVAQLIQNICDVNNLPV
jgi:hypothetical protein